MKNRISRFLTTVLLTAVVFAQGLQVNAEEKGSIEIEKVYLSEDTYFEIVIKTFPVSTLSGEKTAGSKKVSYNASGETMWYVQVFGEFTFDGKTSKCTSASVEAVAVNSSWKIKEKRSSYYDNVALGEAVAQHYSGGIPITSIERQVKLVCSANGKLS